VDPKQNSDQYLIEGTWLIVGLEAGGKAEPEQNYRGNTFAISKDKATLREGKHPPIEFTWAIDPTKTPKAIDLTAKHVSLRGIYKFEGDELTLCLGIGPNRPTDFVTKAGGDMETFSLKRSLWERYSDKTFGFGVDLPGKPEERKRGDTKFQIVRSEAERASYLVSVTPLPAPVADKELDVALEAAKNALLAEVDSDAKATIETEKTFKAGPQGGKELTISLEVTDSKDKGAARVRLFVSGDRVYGLMVAGTEEGVKSANTGRFWNSFRIAGEKKKN